TTPHHPSNCQSGMTLIELTVVILVLLSLIAVLFSGATSWKRGSDRATCILNIRNVQQAVRGHQAMMEKSPADTIVWAQIIGDNGYLTFSPACPAGGAYQPTEKFPAVNTLAYPCDLPASVDHIPADTAGW
ncbi:MAG: type II secretion system GspH family protein, partial [Akkermansiaceae bacterium]|nr:type II secretion system GspH family protein [Akkermansiaceae bacterium]